jgi:hypothetical protein
VLPCDEEKVTIYSARARGDYKIQLDLMPEPFIGLPDAPVVLLNLNPGFDPGDPEVHRYPKYRDVLRNNCCHVSSQFPFFFLHPDFREKPGGRWWRKKLKCLLEEFGERGLARSIFCVEYFPYHSRHFRWPRRLHQLQSQQYGFGLVRSAIGRNAVVVIMRARKRWLESVPELEGYAGVLTLNSPQNVVLSPGNFAGDGFGVVVSAIREHLLDKSFQPAQETFHVGGARTRTA